MASKIILEFNATGGKKTITLSNANPEATNASVKTLVTNYLAAGQYLTPVLVSIIGAKLVTTTEEAFDLSE